MRRRKHMPNLSIGYPDPTADFASALSASSAAVIAGRSLPSRAAPTSLSGGSLDGGSRTLLTVLTVFSAPLRILITLLPAPFTADSNLNT